MSYRQSQVDAINVVSYDFLDLNRQMMELQCLVTSECGIGLYIGELKTYNGEKFYAFLYSHEIIVAHLWKSDSKHIFV